jgi:prepilin-type N-terminal cleavage/methylation domain-containing protein
VIAWVRRRLKGEAGYSLVELLTVMVIMSIVFAGITTVFVSGSKAQTDQDNRFQAQLGSRLALEKVRKDIHCATDVTPYATNKVTLKLPAGCGGDVTWCTISVGGSTTRYALYRQVGANCTAAQGLKIADYLTSANAFPTFAHASGCSCLASLRVDFLISNKGSTLDAYELSDTIFLRNSTRI